MFNRYTFLTLSIVSLGSICCILAKQEQKIQPNNERVAIVPGNQNAVRETDEIKAECAKSAKKKKKKELEQQNNQNQAIVPINNPHANNPQVANQAQQKRIQQNRIQQEASGGKIAIVPGKSSSAVANPAQLNRIQQGMADGKVAIVPGKCSSTVAKEPKKKKKHTSLHNAATAIAHQSTVKPKRPKQYAITKFDEKHAYGKIDRNIAIIPNPMPQVVPQPIAYPVQVVNVAVQTPQRPIVMSRPLPPAVVIDRRSAAYLYATLAPYAISPKGDFIQLEDGSQWKVRHRYYRTVKRWSPNDAILIETGKFFTWSAYKLVNYTRGEFVDVELIEPMRSGALSHWITEINVYDGYLRLQDGSIWRMSANELLNWNVNDDVVIALSKDWFSSHSSYVLINPRAKNRLIAIFSD
jgi:hypothetical protein